MSAMPFVVDTHALGRQPGADREITLTEQAPVELTLEMIGVPAGAPVRIAGRIEAVMEGVLASGEIDVDIHGSCVRCLEAIDYPLSVDFAELFVYDDRRDVVLGAVIDQQAGEGVDGDVVELGGHLGEHVETLLEGEQALFALVHEDGDGDLVEELGGPSDDVEMTIGDRVERAGADDLTHRSDRTKGMSPRNAAHGPA